MIIAIVWSYHDYCILVYMLIYTVFLYFETNNWFLIITTTYSTKEDGYTLYLSLKVGLSPSKKEKKLFYILQWKPFKIDGKCFLFHLWRSFRSQDIYIFVLTFRSCRKNNLIGKISLISKFMTSQPGKQAITIHILLNISRSTSNQIMKFGQLIYYNKINIFHQKSCRKWSREASSRSLFAFKNSFIWDENKWSAA